MGRQPDYARAAAMAARCLIRLQVKTLPVRPMEILRRCRNTVIYTYQQAAEHLNMDEFDFERRCAGAEAFTIRGKTQEGEAAYVVCYRNGGHPGRLNFTLAHELGHMILDHKADDAADEEEANCFAQHLLCPEPALRQLEAEEKLTAQRVSRACFVSLSAAEKVLREKSFFEKDPLKEQLEQLFCADREEKTEAG